SSYKATKAARYIHTLIDYCLNPALKKSMDICIGCGIGICTGTIMITKVGMRGKESDETAENETGIVWVGSTTNYANRYCGLHTLVKYLLMKTHIQKLRIQKYGLKQAEQRAVKSLKDIRSANIICHYRKRLQQKQLRRIKRMILKLHLYKKFLLKHRKKLC